MQRAWNNKSLERLSETPRREAQDSASNWSSRNETRRRSASSDTIAYLQEKCEKDFQLREDELKLRREELELKKSRKTLFCQQNQVLMTVLGMLADKTWKNKTKKTETFKGSPSIFFIVYAFELLIKVEVSYRRRQTKENKSILFMLNHIIYFLTLSLL